MELEELPSHLVVIGGGYIGCEFAQAFRRFGSAVTIVEPGSHLLGHQDEPASEAIERVFRDEGIALLLDARAEQVSGEAGASRSGSRAEARWWAPTSSSPPDAGPTPTISAPTPPA